MATTPGQYGWPIPDLPDDANGPQQLLDLGGAIESLLTNGTLKMSTGVIEAADPTAAKNPVTKQWFEQRIVIGAAGSAPAAGALPAGSVYFGV